MGDLIFYPTNPALVQLTSALKKRSLRSGTACWRIKPSRCSCINRSVCECFSSCYQPCKHLLERGSQIAIFLYHRTGNSAFGLLLSIMCEQTKISSLTQSCACLAGPLRATKRNTPSVKETNETPGSGRRQPSCEGSTFPLPAEQNGINYIMCSFSSLGRKGTEKKWFEESIFFSYAKLSRRHFWSGSAAEGTSRHL